MVTAKSQLVISFGFISFIAIGVLPSKAIASSRLSLPFWSESKWIFKGTGHHQGWADQRDLFVLYHPWEESQSGYSGSVSQEVSIPHDWQDRVRIHFYMTDDYRGHHERLGDDSWLGQMSLFGHRFKQLLVNDEVIWERDVADSEGVSKPSHFSVLLPEHIKTRSRIRIEFRLLDKIESSLHLENDYRHVGATDGDIQKSDPWKFMTHVYIGDVILTPGSTEKLDTGESPNSAQARKVHSERWPLKPYGLDIDFPVSLSYQGNTGGSSISYAVRCGIPIPSGKVQDTGQITLSSQNGKHLPLQLSPMNYWPDGSLRWVELDTIASMDDVGEEGQFLLNIDHNRTQSNLPDKPVVVTRKDDTSFSISTGEMKMDTGGDNGILISKIVSGNSKIADLTGEIQIGDKIYKAITDSSKILAQGPIRGEVELSGKIQSENDEIGRFVLRLSAMTGQPYIRMTWRIFNDQSETLEISRFELIGRHQMTDKAVCRWDIDKSSKGKVCIRQLAEDKYDVIDSNGDIIDTGKAASGWIGVNDDQSSLVMLVRHFRQQFPKALEIKEDRFRISLFEASQDHPHYLLTSGEAKRHEIWLGLWNEALSSADMTDTAKFFSKPRRLFDAEYFCASGGFGYAEAHNSRQFADLDAYMNKKYGNTNEKDFYEMGIRNWGDHPYRRNKNTWRNGYYDRQQGFASEYLMTGDPRWFDHLEATVRHIMDVDVCHASAEKPDLVGSIYSCYAVNHTDGSPWDMMQRTKGMLAYWRLTGDIDARDTALEVANSAIRNNRGIGRVSVRDHGGILYCLISAYDETGAEKYLEAAKRVAHDAMGRIDSRRGCYSEVHGNTSYRGNIPWMVAQLAQPMYEYYRYSGDIDASVAVVGMAESVLMENCTRGVWGDVHGYSHNPHFKKSSEYHILIAPAILYAYELTGSDLFLRHGCAMYAQTIRENGVNSISGCYWNTPTLLYYLKHFGRR